MSKQAKHLFDRRSRFAIRKLATGVFSVVIGHVLFLSPQTTVAAQEIPQTSTTESISQPENVNVSEKGNELSETSKPEEVPTTDASSPKAEAESSVSSSEKTEESSQPQRDEIVREVGRENQVLDQNDVATKKIINGWI